MDQIKNAEKEVELLRKVRQGRLAPSLAEKSQDHGMIFVQPVPVM